MTLVLILLSGLFSSNINEQTEPFYNYKEDKIFFVNQIYKPPVIDGILNDDCWEHLNEIDKSGNYIDEFIQDYPNNLSSPTFKTFVSIGSDSKNIYIAARLFDSNPDSIMQRLSRKDDLNPWLSDWFSIEFDSNHDHKTAYRFAVNASGVQLDGMIYNDSEFDLEYNAIWESDIQIDEYGWKIEMKIPFNMLSITQLENPWGLNINRFIFRYNEMNRWIALTDGTPGVVSHFGHIMGFKETEIRKSIEFKPYILSGHDRYNNSLLVDPERFANNHFINTSDSLSSNIGLDLKYRLSPSSALDITINPDFGQIEMDPKYINLTYYEIFLPEKRPFFNETESMFDTPISIFYSRRIGQPSMMNRSEYRINTALKLMGNIDNGWSYGIILADTSPRTGYEYPDYRKNYIISRATKDFLDGQHKIGLSHTYFSFDLNNSDKLIEESYSFDHIAYLASNRIFIDYQITQSINDNRCDENCNFNQNYPLIGYGYRLNTGYSSSYPISFSIDIENYDKDFNINQIGFLSRNNIKKYKLNLAYRTIEPIPSIREIEFKIIRSESINYDNFKIGDIVGFESMIESENYNYVRFSYYLHRKHYDDYFTYDYELNKIGLPFHIPQSFQSAIKFYSDMREDLSFNIGLEYKETQIHENNQFNAKDNYFGFDFRLISKINFISIRNISFYYEMRNSNQVYAFVELLPYEYDDTEDVEHNIFANKNGWLHRYNIGLEEYFTNKISLYLHFEYLQIFDKYSNYTELIDMNSLPQITDIITGYTSTSLNMEMEEVITEIPPIYTNNDSEPIYDEESESLLQDVNPNYYIGFYPRYTNFNLSFSFKFEYNPNSDIYVIYRLSRSINGKIFNNINDFLMYSGDDRWSERYFDASFYIKFNYWFDI